MQALLNVLMGEAADCRNLVFYLKLCAADFNSFVSYLQLKGLLDYFFGNYCLRKLKQVEDNIYALSMSRRRQYAYSLFTLHY